MTQKTIQAHRVETTLTSGGRLILEDLPYPAGQAVEVIVLPRIGPAPGNPYPLRGKPLVYKDPFEPAVPPEEWDAPK
jgi:hypothetical protein